MPNPSQTPVLTAGLQAPRTKVSGIIGNVTPNALTVNGQPYARGTRFQGTWPSENDVGRPCELTLVQARTGLFVVAVMLAAAAVIPPAQAETEAEAPQAPKPISPKQLEILVERSKERKLEVELVQISKLRFGKRPEELTSQEASFMIDFLGRHPASWQRMRVQQ
jgi:hypothetical protein